MLNLDFEHGLLQGLFLPTEHALYLCEQDLIEQGVPQLNCYDFHRIEREK